MPRYEVNMKTKITLLIATLLLGACATNTQPLTSGLPEDMKQEEQHVDIMGSVVEGLVSGVVQEVVKAAFF